MHILGSGDAFDLADLDAWPLLAKTLACAVAGVFAAAVGYGVGLSDARAALAAAKAETARRTAEQHRKRALAHRSAAASTERDEASVALAALRAQLPGATEVPGLLAAVRRAATAAGLAVGHVGLGDERPLWLGPPPTGEAGGGQTAPYVEMPLQIQVLGSYHQLGAFAAAVAALPRLVILGDFELRPVDDDPARLTLAVAAATYRQAPSAGPSAQAPGPPVPAATALATRPPAAGGIYRYRSTTLRSPFEPDHVGAVLATDGAKPDPYRPRGPLERFRLEQLRLVGGMAAAGMRYALVADPAATVHRVAVGDYLGMNHGRVTSVSRRELALREIVRNGTGDWAWRPRSLVAIDQPDGPRGGSAESPKPAEQAAGAHAVATPAVPKPQQPGPGPRGKR